MMLINFWASISNRSWFGGGEIGGCKGAVLQKICQREGKSNQWYEQNDGEDRKGSKSLEVKLQSNINLMIFKLK